LYGTNAQETKITLFGDGGDKLVGCFRQGTAAATKKKRKTVNESQIPSLGKKVFHPWVIYISIPGTESF